MPLYEQFLLVGDSLTQQSASQARGFGLTPALQDAYIRRLDVINRGFSGYNSAQALKILPEIVPSPQFARIRLMTVFLGANDACLPDYHTKQHIPVETYAQCLKGIITHPSVLAHSPKIILITPPPVDERTLQENDPQISRTAEHTSLYAEAARKVGAELNVAVLDLWKIFMTQAGWKEGQPLPGSNSVAQSPFLKELLPDGLHFNPKAYEVMYDALMKTIETRWPEEMPEKLPFVFPPWEIAPK